MVIAKRKFGVNTRSNFEIATLLFKLVCGTSMYLERRLLHILIKTWLF